MNELEIIQRMGLLVLEHSQQRLELLDRQIAEWSEFAQQGGPQTLAASGPFEALLADHERTLAGIEYAQRLIGAKRETDVIAALADLQTA